MLIRLKNGPWASVEDLPFVTESEFQALFQETFEQVLATLSDAAAVIAREVSMPDGGKIDIVAIDADGVVTVCECKLQSNAGIRREVVGQVFEYAANLNGMSFREFRRRVEARLGSDLTAAMAERSPDDWDEDVWVDQVSAGLEAGRFRVIVAVDKMAPTLKDTILYLNAQAADLAVLAVELHRARLGDVEILVPTIFADEQAQKKVPTPSSAAEVQDADTVIVAATHAWGEYERTGAYICQPQRSFRSNAEYFGFYAKRRIEPLFPKIAAFKRDLVFDSETISKLRATGDPLDAQAAEIIAREIASSNGLRNEGESHQIVLLDPDRGFELKQAIRHEGHAAWLRGQRYTVSRALKTEPATTEELRAAGG